MIYKEKEKKKKTEKIHQPVSGMKQFAAALKMWSNLNQMIVTSKWVVVSEFITLIMNISICI